MQSEQLRHESSLRTLWFDHNTRQTLSIREDSPPWPEKIDVSGMPAHSVRHHKNTRKCS
jgi:hypothetical protein